MINIQTWRYYLNVSVVIGLSAFGLGDEKTQTKVYKGVLT